MKCEFSHRSDDDPIVYPSEPGRAHTHDFFGSTATDAASTPESLRGTETTCEDPRDTAAYWVPALSVGGEMIYPSALYAYYRAVPGSDRRAVIANPEGIELLAGDMHADSPQPLDEVAWSCGPRPETLHVAPPDDCEESNPLTLHLFFPDCWDGERLRSDDNRSHSAYSDDGKCPPTHPVAMLELHLAVEWPLWGALDSVALSSGDPISAHGDFMNGWDQDALEALTVRCVHENSGCPIDYTIGSAYQPCGSDITLVAPITDASAYCETTGTGVTAVMSDAGAALVTKPGQATCEEVTVRSGGVPIGCPDDAFDGVVTEGAIGVTCAVAPCTLAVETTRPVEFQAGLGGAPESVRVSQITVRP